MAQRTFPRWGDLYLVGFDPTVGGWNSNDTADFGDSEVWRSTFQELMVSGLCAVAPTIEVGRGNRGAKVREDFSLMRVPFGTSTM
jgi:hypothetical protein